MSTRALTIAAATVVAVVALACASGGSQSEDPVPVDTSTSSSSEETPHGDIGDTLTITATLTDAPVADVTVTDVNIDTANPSSFAEPGNGGYITMNVTVAAHETYMVSPVSFALVADDGTAYTAEAIVAGATDIVELQTLNAGQKTSGVLWFDVDIDLFDQGGHVSLTNLNEQAGVWDLS
jgi:uncharacterized protein involved in high-affinity Fe2+ transport